MLFEAWGRLRRLECGDTMLASEIVPREMDDARDATFVRVRVSSFSFSDFISFQMQYEALVDKNARSANGKSGPSDRPFPSHARGANAGVGLYRGWLG